MKAGASRIIYIFIITLLIALNTRASDSLAKFPVAILVQLRSEHNRIEALTKAHWNKELEIVKADAAGETSATINDFKDYFNFCPVYFFIDTNAEKVQNMQFEGILLDTNLAPAKNILISKLSKNYLIVYYGFPLAQDVAADLRSDSVVNENSTTPTQFKGLIINNYKFQQLTYIFKSETDFISFKKKNKKQKYLYVSDKFDIEYFPFAGILNEELYKQGKKIPIIHGSLKGKFSLNATKTH
jgi:hypothetical protein